MVSSDNKIIIYSRDYIDFDNIFPDSDSTHEIAHDYHQFMMTIVITNDDAEALVNDINSM